MEHDPLGRRRNAVMALIQGGQLGEDRIVVVCHCGGPRWVGGVVGNAMRPTETLMSVGGRTGWKMEWAVSQIELSVSSLSSTQRRISSTEP